MIDWLLLLIYTLAAAAIFFIMWLVLDCAIEWDNWENATPKEKKKWMYRFGIIGILLLVVATLFALYPRHIIISIFIDVPLSVILLFIINLVRYCLAKTQQEKNPDTVAEKLKFRKVCVLVFAVLSIVALVAFLTLLFLPSSNIIYM